MAATLAPKGLVPQDQTKKLAHRVELLGQPLSLKKVFENVGPEHPLPLIEIASLYFFQFFHLSFYSRTNQLFGSRNDHFIDRFQSSLGGIFM